VSTPQWEDQWPGRFQYELDALRAEGISFTVDQELLAERILRIKFVHVVGGKEVRGEAVFPDSYPSFRPAVRAESLGLTHHQNPLRGEAGGNLCLLGRGGDRWYPRYTLAWLLTHQLPLVVRAGDPGAASAATSLEDMQAEPYSAYVPSEPDSALLVDGDWVIPSDVKWGRLVLGTCEPVDGRSLRGAVLEIRDGSDNLIVAADPNVAVLYSVRSHALWARSSLTDPSDPIAVVNEAVANIPGAKVKTWPFITTRNGRIRLLGVRIPEEVAHREKGEGWLFRVEPEVKRG
jgi:hypothetical protein